MATWETLLSTMGIGLVSGGAVSLVYGFLCKFNAQSIMFDESAPC